jgi:hypothetical protein
MVGRRGLMRIGVVVMVMAVVTVGLLPQTLCAQVVDPVLGFGRSSAVGGVSIDAQGVISAPQVMALRELQVARQKALRQVPGALSQPARLRKVSLRRLEKALESQTGDVVALPDELQYLAGLQRVEYVFVFPEQHDIVLAGPAEGWQIDALGNVVGQTTGRPVVLLDDLMIAMRTARTSAQTGISCSIDPTPEGVLRLRKLVRQLRTIGNPQQTLSMIEQALGPQVVSVTGVPTSTHFARVMVAADFRMKRLAMHFDRPPIPDLPSYLELLKPSQRGMQNLLPRWWLAPLYEPLQTDADGLSWQLRGQGVQCMTETDFVDQHGISKATGKAGAAATKWANNMTAHFDELATQDSAFGSLRNAMDLAVIAALSEKEDMLNRAGLELPFIRGEIAARGYAAPKQVATQASFVKKGRNYLISASGGVQIYPWEIAAKKQVGEDLTATRKLALPATDQWWWN